MAEPRETTDTTDEVRYTRPRVTSAARLRSPVLDAHRWRLCALLALVGFLLSSGAAFYFAGRSTTTLHVVTVDAHNRVLALGPPEIPEDRRVLGIKHSLAQVIEWVRTVPGDVDLLKQNWQRALLFMTPEGAEMLKQFGREVRPDQMAKDWRVRVQIREVQPVTTSSYLVEWEERFYKLPDMQLRQAKRYASVLSFRIEPPTQETAEARLNWLGVKVYDAHWYAQPDVSRAAPRPVSAQKGELP